MIKAIITVGEAEYSCKVKDYYEIYDLMMEITDNDHEESENAASWCELACVGETYEFREGYIEIWEV